jgi:hypothetical protein
LWSLSGSPGSSPVGCSWSAPSAPRRRRCAGCWCSSRFWKFNNYLIKYTIWYLFIDSKYRRNILQNIREIFTHNYFFFVNIYSEIQGSK